MAGEIGMFLKNEFKNQNSRVIYFNCLLNYDINEVYFFEARFIAYIALFLNKEITRCLLCKRDVVLPE